MKTLLFGSSISLACHGVTAWALLWWATSASPTTAPEPPEFRRGDQAVRVRWRPRAAKLRSEETAPIKSASRQPAPRPKANTAPATDDSRVTPSVRSSWRALEDPWLGRRPRLAPPQLRETDSESVSLQTARAETPLVSANLTPFSGTPVAPSKVRLPEAPADLQTRNESAREDSTPPLKNDPPVTHGTRDGARLETPLAPIYPRTCVRRRHEGTVLLRCELTSTGSLRSAHVVRSSGCDKLDAAALSAVREAHFRSAAQDGRPIASTVNLPVVFQLE